MAINVTRANQQAAEIAGKVAELRIAKNHLLKYKSELQCNWQGREVGLFVQSVDDSIAKINALLGTLTTLSNDIKTTADAIYREEKAAEEAAAARAAQERKMAQARQAYNAACNELDVIIKERAALLEQMRNTKSVKTMVALNEKLIEIDKRLADAQEVCNRCREAF